MGTGRSQDWCRLHCLRLILLRSVRHTQPSQGFLNLNLSRGQNAYDCKEVKRKPEEQGKKNTRTLLTLLRTVAPHRDYESHARLSAPATMNPSGFPSTQLRWHLPRQLPRQLPVAPFAPVYWEQDRDGPNLHPQSRPGRGTPRRTGREESLEACAVRLPN